MPLVTKWTGREVKALREAVRMSLMEFAEKLGVSDRIVSRWEADGERATLRMVNQAALDSLLAKADKDAQGRFVGIVSVDDVPAHAIIEPDADHASSGDYVKHPGDGKLMAYIPEGICLSGDDDDPVWVDEFHIDTFPTTPGRYELRGSAFISPLFRGSPAMSNDASELMHDDETGFRCVASQPSMDDSR